MTVIKPAGLCADCGSPDYTHRIDCPAADTKFYGFTIHGTLMATSPAEAESSGGLLVGALYGLDFVSDAESWISLTPSADSGV